MNTLTYGDETAFIKARQMGLTSKMVKFSAGGVTITTFRMKKRWRLWYAIKRLMQFKRPVNQWKPTKETK